MIEQLSSQELAPRFTACRWGSVAEIQAWVNAFQDFFPRKAHRAQFAAARLCGFDSFEELADEAPGFEIVPNHGDGYDDDLYAERRLHDFEADRLTLIHELGILPDAADHFLTACPVGATDFVYQSRLLPLLDDSLCYYADEQTPSSNLPAIIKSQYEEALSQNIKHPASEARIGEFHHPAIIYGLCGFLGLNFATDMTGNDGLDHSVPASRIGWINDPELGGVECVSLPFTVYPNWGRDELFRNVCGALFHTRKLRDKPVLILNKLPLQLVQAGHAFTSLGYLLFEGRIDPFFVTPHKLSLADLIVESTMFNPATSTRLVDTDNRALNTYWTLLTDHDDSRLPASPRFRKSPDNWMLPNWK